MRLQGWTQGLHGARGGPSVLLFTGKPLDYSVTPVGTEETARIRCDLQGKPPAQCQDTGGIGCPFPSTSGSAQCRLVVEPQEMVGRLLDTPSLCPCLSEPEAGNPQAGSHRTRGSHFIARTPKPREGRHLPKVPQPGGFGAGLGWLPLLVPRTVSTNPPFCFQAALHSCPSELLLQSVLL